MRFSAEKTADLVRHAVKMLLDSAETDEEKDLAAELRLRARRIDEARADAESPSIPEGRRQALAFIDDGDPS